MSEMLELAKRIAERAGKNAKVAPELLYAPILWELQDDARSSAVSAQVCGACGHTWTGEKCGQANNGWPHEVCYPVAATEPQTAPPMLCGVCGEWHQEASGCAPPLRAERERRMVAEISFDPTNHHNALKCPYCNPKGLAFAEPQTLPVKLTGEIACILEDCSPPDKQTPEAVAALIEGYQPTWDRIRSALTRSQAESAQKGSK
jgi:hypothetical protein